jgi:hypothetical protein
MKSKAPFVWALIGVIFGFFESLMRIGQYFMAKSLNQRLSGNLFNFAGLDLGVIMIWSLILSIIGLILSIALIFYVVKLAKNPTKKDYIVTTVLGGLGLFLGMGLGGILVLVGGIIGIVKSNKPELASQ